MNYRESGVKMDTNLAEQLNLHNIDFWTVTADSLDSNQVYMNGIKMSRKRVPNIEHLARRVSNEWIYLPGHSYTFVRFH